MQLATRVGKYLNLLLILPENEEREALNKTILTKFEGSFQPSEVEFILREITKQL